MQILLIPRHFNNQMLVPINPYIRKFTWKTYSIHIVKHSPLYVLPSDRPYEYFVANSGSVGNYTETAQFEITEKAVTRRRLDGPQGLH
jgi:hypothetical protein